MPGIAAMSWPAIGGEAAPSIVLPGIAAMSWPAGMVIAFAGAVLWDRLATAPFTPRPVRFFGAGLPFRVAAFFAGGGAIVMPGIAIPGMCI